MLPNFIYQKDYASTTDFANQITRSIKFFQYLENSEKFKEYVSQYYQNLKVRDSRDLIHNILTIFTQVGIGQPGEHRKQFIPLDNIISLVNINFIKSLSINDTIRTYVGYKGNFLSVKGKEFMEDIYFRHIMERCFSSGIHLAGDDAKKNDGNEICDYYIRYGNNVILVEFKDVLLNATFKEQSHKESLYKELDKKFYENQKKDPKGIQQLFNAASYLENNNPEYDTLPTSEVINVYPVVIYTDLSFGYEGVNKILNQKFNELTDSMEFEKLEIKDVTFINLNYFEVHEDYLKQGLINLFDIIAGYHSHILNEDYSTTPFEVYSRFYLKTNIKKELGNPSFMLEVIKEIIPAAIDNIR